MPRKLLITAALPYANGRLHLGHLRSTYLPADVFAKYAKLAGHDAVFVCATDEHGSPIELKALKEGKSPEEFVAVYRKKILVDLTAAGIVFDNFYQTHCPEGRELSTDFYQKAVEGGYIFEKKVVQYFCPKDGRFLPDRYLKGTCPYCGTTDQYSDNCESCGRVYSPDALKEPKCALCGTAPVQKEASHAFFKLSAFAPFFQEWFAQNQKLPQDVVHYLQNWLKEGLQDWDITRDGPYFGFEMPGRENQYFYVWFDAPIGYVSSTKNWADRNGKSWAAYWKNEKCELIHFIGKDIIYHHFLFWPAMLKSAGYQLPSRIPVRGYLNLGGEKMSKSRGVYLYLDEFLEKYPADYLRYYLTAVTPNTNTDANFTLDEFAAKVNGELIDSYGNFTHRVLTFVQTKFEGKVPEPTGYSDADRAFAQRLEQIAAETAADLEECELKGGLEKIMAFAGECNKYFNDRAPWKMMKDGDANARTVIYLSAKAIYAIASLLSPFLTSSPAVFDLLGSPAPKKWGDWSAFKPGAQLKAPRILYEKIELPTITPTTPKEKS